MDRKLCNQDGKLVCAFALRSLHSLCFCVLCTLCAFAFACLGARTYSSCRVSARLRLLICTNNCSRIAAILLYPERSAAIPLCPSSIAAILLCPSSARRILTQRRSECMGKHTQTEQDQPNLEGIILSELHRYAQRQLGQVPPPKPKALVTIDMVEYLEYRSLESRSRLRLPHTLAPSSRRAAPVSSPWHNQRGIIYATLIMPRAFHDTTHLPLLIMPRTFDYGTRFALCHPHSATHSPLSHALSITPRTFFYATLIMGPRSLPTFYYATLITHFALCLAPFMRAFGGILRCIRVFYFRGFVILLSAGRQSEVPRCH